MLFLLGSTGIYPEIEFPSYKIFVQNLKIIPNCFPKSLYQFTCSPALYPVNPYPL